MEILDENLSKVKDIRINDYSLNVMKDVEPILCNHCMRTASNGIRCMGICVADNDY